ncbi:MAG: hypothetical protein Q4C95_03100 [Planctomycetia bacterium]|nr:hypothetical protein [Planctomycetia bacterium]
MKPNNDNIPENRTDRRTALKQILGLPVLGGLGYCASGLMLEEQTLLSQESSPDSTKVSQETDAQVDGVSGATRTSWEMPKLETLKEPIPKAKIGDLEVSRVILGGNLMGGWAHSRDLIYVSELVKQYHTKEKVFQTFQLAEKCGINTFMGNPVMNQMLEEYWRWTDGKMQFISDCGAGGKSMPDNVKLAIDFGCDACYIHGGICDSLVANKDFKTIEECLRIMTDNGLPTGIGAHSQATVQGIVDAGLVPDFWMKTFHHKNYWSAQQNEAYSCFSVFCPEPDETREFMQNRDEPWIAFKIFAAGAIPPNEGFRFAFEGGADFVCVGMYDFQIVDDINLCVDILKSPLNRKRRQLETLAMN